MKQYAYEFAVIDKFKVLVKKYSEFINFSISIWASKEVTKEVSVEEEIEVTNNDH